ncbi:hypothetical protein JYU34_009879, partial [Plutella xylostella]
MRGGYGLSPRGIAHCPPPRGSHLTLNITCIGDEGTLPRSSYANCKSSKTEKLRDTAAAATRYN